jgi:hypothetical protein
MQSIRFQFYSYRNLLSYVAGSSPSSLRDCFLKNCATELAVCSQAVMPRLEHLGAVTELMTPKSQHEKINHVGNACLNPVAETQDWKKFALSRTATVDGSVMDTSAEALLKQVGGWFPCKYCGKCYSDKKKLSTHQREDCGNGPGFECPYCHVKIRRRGNLFRHVRHFHT